MCVIRGNKDVKDFAL